MADYSQPPYGMTYPFHPPQHPQQVQHSQQASAPPVNHAVMTDHNPYTTPQFSAGLPGLNLQSYTQNMQQPQFQPWHVPPPPHQNPYGVAFPPPFHPPNGFPLPPPPMPPPGYLSQGQPVQSVQPASLPGLSGSQINQSAQTSQQPTAKIDRVVHMADSDREEGELSETDGASRVPGGSRAIGEVPQSVSVGARDAARKDNRNGHGSTTILNMKNPVQPDMGYALPLRNDQKRDKAREFLKLLHNNNIGYSKLAAEDLDPELLREEYRKLGLSTQPNSPMTEAPPSTVKSTRDAAPRTGPAASTSSTTSGTIARDQTLPQGQGLPAKPLSSLPTPAPPVKTNVGHTAPIKSAPSPVDRKEYIARLQAAKLGKQANTVKATPQQSPAPTDSNPTPASNGVQAAQTPATKTASRVPKEVQNALLRQRIEELKALQKPANSPTPQLSDAGDKAPVSNDEARPAEAHASSQPSHVTPLSKIPGLFMNSSPAPTPPELPAKPPFPPQQNGTSTASRKRPVAADFDDDTPRPTSRPAYTRPLGQSPHEHESESMIIQVSDDDSGGSEMDLDDIQTGPQPASTAPPTSLVRNGTRSLQDGPPLSGLPSRSLSAIPTPSATTTPPAPRTPADLTAEEIAKREKAISDLKMKIRAMTMKKGAAKAKKDAIVSSPGPQRLGPGVYGNANGASPVVSTESSRMSAGGSLLSGNEPSSTVESESKVTSAESRNLRRQRRAELESALRSLDSGLESDNIRLAQLEKEMTEIRLKREQYQRDREKLVKELEAYGIDTEGMGDEELQAQKKEIDLHHSMEKSQAVPSDAPTAEGPDTANTMDDSKQMQEGSVPSLTELPAGAPSREPNGADVDPEPKKKRQRGPKRNLKKRLEARLQALAVVPSAVERGEPPASDLPKSPTAITEGNLSQSATTTPPVPDATPLPAESHPVLASEKVTPQPAEPDAPGPTRPTTDKIVESTTSADDEDFYSPEPDLPPLVTQPQAMESQGGGIKSPSEEGEVAMSESPADEEDEYEPEVSQAETAPVPATEDVEMEIEDSPAPSVPAEALSSTEDEGEIYEPPEPNQKLPDVDTGAAVAPAAVTQTTDADADDQAEMEISPVSSDESDFPPTSSSEKAHRRSISLNGPSESGPAVADDLAPELQPLAPPPPTMALVNEQGAEADLGADPTRFVPYQSPLRMFKSYRYHPSYSQDVAGGFLSLTYSHQIDPNKPLCRFESVGGTCNDPQCEGQHWRDMSITGDKLLVQLGAVNPGQTTEERQKWNEGLRQVLKDLRQRKMQDPNGIAMEIVKYRRQFFDDNTRVVNL